MSPGFDEAFRRVKQLVADFRANEKFYLAPAYQEQEARHDGFDRCPSLAGVIGFQPSAFPPSVAALLRRTGSLQHCRSDALVYDLF
jgi:hypothetical protein